MTFRTLAKYDISALGCLRGGMPYGAAGYDGLSQDQITIIEP